MSKIYSKYWLWISIGLLSYVLVIVVCYWFIAQQPAMTILSFDKTPAPKPIPEHKLIASVLKTMDIPFSYEQPETITQAFQQLHGEYVTASEKLKEMGMPDSDPQKDEAEVITNDQLFERYNQESEKLHKVSIPIFRYLKVEEAIYFDRARIQRRHWLEQIEDRWEKEYEQPLFEAAKLAMKRVTGTDDYLAMWENRIPEKIETIQSIVVPASPYSERRGYTLFQLYTLAVLHEKQSELLAGILFREYEDTGNTLSASRVNSNFVLRPMTFPSIRYSVGAYDESWEIMAIYSFKNDRARDILFEIVLNSYADQESPIRFSYSHPANSAAFYLTLLPNSDELLPQAKILLKEATASVQENRYDWGERFFDDNGDVSNPWQLLSQIQNRRLKRLPDEVQQLFYFARLVRALEFNEKISVEERERFDVFRREIAINEVLDAGNPYSHVPSRPTVKATLQKGDEHFEIYWLEYALPGYGTFFEWEPDVNPDPHTLENPYWQRRKEVYEREWANPRSIYTEWQRANITNTVKPLRAMSAAKVLQGHGNGIQSAVFSSDGKKVLTSSDDRTARIWDAATGKELKKFAGHTEVVRSAAFSPDEKRVVTCSDDKTARIWDTETGRELQKFEGHT